MPQTIILTTEMLCILALLGFTIYLFVSEIVSVDVAALVVMVLLGLLTLVPGLEQIIDHSSLLSGFSSNAVISVIAVMIIGAGLDKTGLMSRVAAFILQTGGNRERGIIPLVSGVAGLISSFMQNVGAAALFIPVVSRIAARTGLPLSRLLMPMGFCAILGGTVTMIGSSPLILLNDLIQNSNRALPPEQHMQDFALFAVTPIGLALVVTGILYFVFAGRYVLPAVNGSSETMIGGRTIEYFRRVYGLDAVIFEIRVPRESNLVNRRINVVERATGVRIIAQRAAGVSRLAPVGERLIEADAIIAVLASPDVIKKFVENYQLELRPQLKTFADALNYSKAGIAELVIPPDSRIINQTIRELVLRNTFGLAALAIHRGKETIRTGLRDIPLQAGDTLVCHTTWENLAKLERDRSFVVITSEYPHEELRPQKVTHALVFFAAALGLVLFSDLPLSVALLVGAVGMIVSNVLSIDEAYRAVSWKTVFLLACLIPLGQAVESTGTAAWIAHQVLLWLEDVPIWVLQAVIALLATAFTLVMSNIGATVLLVPLAVNIALGAGADPALFALTVAIATSNSFLIPTHQVNALIMGPAGYQVKDFIRAGGVMTVLFLVVSQLMMNLVF